MVMFFNQYNMEQQEEIAEKIIKQAYDDGGEVCLCDTDLKHVKISSEAKPTI
jgi:hypothetical protein